MIFFTSDTHYGHANILKYCPSRGHSTLEDMQEDYIKKWNSKITNSDVVYFLGDFSFMQDYAKIELIYNKLAGKKYLIKGNHDHEVTCKLPWLWIKDRHEFLHQKKRVVLDHFPMSSWNASSHGSYQLHGHTHGNNTTKKLRLDVGVDCHNGYPISINEAFEILIAKENSNKLPLNEL